MLRQQQVLLASRGLALLALLVLPGAVAPACSSSPSGGGSPGSGGDNAGAGGDAAAGGSSGNPGSGGSASGSGGAAAGGGGSTGSGGQGGSALGSGGQGGATGAGGATDAGVIGGKLPANPRIMLLGDSTTASICYRSHLWQMLTQAGHTQFDFIGTRKGDPGCSFKAYDQDNEGHGGYIVTDVLKATSTGRPAGGDASDPFVSSSADLATWFDGHPADLVLMHFGTNDVWNSKPPAMILSAYSAILTRLRANNPNVRMMVAQITPLNPTSGCATCQTGVPALNSMIPGWATQNSTAQSPVTVVDQYTGFNDATDTMDGVHANDAGSVKIATNWYNAVVPLF
jgi:lysophospholipase L1-like esterase